MIRHLFFFFVFCIAEKFLLCRYAERVVDRQMKLLYAVRFLVGHGEEDVGQGAQPASAHARQGDDGDAEGASNLRGIENILRIARRADGEKDVALLSHAEYLLGKDEVGRLVVGECRAKGDLIDEGEGGQGFLQVLDKVCRILRAGI